MDVNESVMYGKRLKITRVLPEVYLLNDADSGTGYLVLGKERALVIDTCNGRQNYKKAIETLTDLPLIVVNTHAHGDHTGGNRFFDKALIGEKELKDYREKDCPAEIIRDGGSIDLGEKTIEAISFAGHTPEGICLLSRADRCLFTGDSVLGRTVWMFMPNSVNISTLKKSLQKLNAFRGEFDCLLTGHGVKLDPPVYIDRLIEACDIIEAGEPNERFGTSNIWNHDFPCCYYEGEDGMQATLVYTEQSSK